MPFSNRQVVARKLDELARDRGKNVLDQNRWGSPQTQTGRGVTDDRTVEDEVLRFDRETLGWTIDGSSVWFCTMFLSSDEVVTDDE